MTPAPTLQELIDTVKADAPTEGVLQQLTQASRTVADLEEVSDSLLGHFVDRCRRSGHSWSEISVALGVSKQAAHKRFSPSPAGAPTFERFTVKARAALAGAAEQARRRGETKVGAEHLLLALFEPSDSLAARALAAAGITPALVEQQLDLDSLSVARDSAEPARDPVPFAPATVAALRGALGEALERGHNYIGTEHLLLALYQDEHSPAVEALRRLGASHEQTAARLTEYLGGFKRPG